MTFKHTLRLAAVLPALLLAACVSTPAPPEANVDVASLLEEINAAITKSIPNDPDFPALTSINLDLQVSVGASLNATVPVNVVSVSPSVDRQKLHRVVIDFVPSPVRKPSALGSDEAKAEGMLEAAIKTLYQSVAHASPVYKLQRGSISLQCTLKTQGSAGVKLVPLQANASASRQVIQTLTINWGRDPNRIMLERDVNQSSPRQSTSPSPAPASVTE